MTSVMEPDVKTEPEGEEPTESVTEAVSEELPKTEGGEIDLTKLTAQQLELVLEGMKAGHSEALEQIRKDAIEYQRRGDYCKPGMLDFFDKHGLDRPGVKVLVTVSFPMFIEGIDGHAILTQEDVTEDRKTYVIERLKARLEVYLGNVRGLQGDFNSANDSNRRRIRISFPGSKTKKQAEKDFAEDVQPEQSGETTGETIAQRLGLDRAEAQPPGMADVHQNRVDLNSSTNRLRLGVRNDFYR